MLDAKSQIPTASSSDQKEIKDIVSNEIKTELSNSSQSLGVKGSELAKEISEKITDQVTKTATKP